MAVSSLSAISGALSLLFDKKLARQWNRMARTLSIVSAQPEGGKSVNWDISTSGQTAGTHTEGADITAGELLIDAKLPMTLDWGLYRNAFGLTEHQLEVALGSKNSAEQLMQLLEESVFESVAALTSKLNQDLFSGDGTSNAMVGLDNALIITGTYGGKDVTSYTSLKSNIDANGGTPRSLSIDLMETSETAIFTRSGLRPNVIVTTPTVFKKYKGLFEPVRRVVGDSPNVYDTSVADDSVYFQGIPVIRDKDATAGKMYFLNTDQMSCKFVPPANFGDSVSFAVKMAMGSNGDGVDQAAGLPIRIQALAKTGDSVKFFLRTACQLAIKRPNAFAVIEDLA